MKKHGVILLGWGLVFAGWVVLATAFPAAANTLQTQGFLADDLLSKLNSWFWNVVGPLAFTFSVIYVIASLLKGHMIGSRVAQAVAIAFIIGGGLPWISGTLGVNLAFGAERPVVEMVDSPAAGALPFSPWEP